jgi:hypothetical protein
MYLWDELVVIHESLVVCVDLGVGYMQPKLQCEQDPEFNGHEFTSRQLERVLDLLQT